MIRIFFEVHFLSDSCNYFSASGRLRQQLKAQSRGQVRKADTGREGQV